MSKVLIVGASTGIGNALAIKLANEGHRVYGTFCKNEQQSKHDNLSFHKLDVLEDEFDLSFLDEQLDGVVYCPGSINLKPFARIKANAFLEDFKLQVGGAIRIVQGVLPKLKKSSTASIVFFSTVAVKMGFSFHTQVSTSKGAIEGFTRALAAELAPKVRVNCIAPSLTDTPLAGSLLSTAEKREANAQRHPLKKIGTPENIAEMAAFLLDPKTEWITGQIMHVDGGISSIR